MLSKKQRPNKIVAIVQARLGSTRLPLKSLLTLKDRPVIDWVYKRLTLAKRLDEIIIAIPDTPDDQILADYLNNQKIPFIRGPENDVLGRFMLASNEVRADVIVRVCADNPLVWGEAVDELIGFYEEMGADYAYNHIPRNNLWPDGLGAEIISREVLNHLNKKAKKASQREHCLNYIWDNPAQFKIGTFNPMPELQHPELKLDMDTPRDYYNLACKPIHWEMSGEEIIKIFLDAKKEKISNS